MHYGPAEWAGAITTVITGIGTLVTLIFNLKQGRKNAGSIQEVHGLVNDRATKQDNRIDQLTAALGTSDTAVPERKPNGR